MKTLLLIIRCSFLNSRLGTPKFLILSIMILMKVLLNAQDYTFVRGSFNTAGGLTQNSQYSSQIAVGEDEQGTSTTSSYTTYLGFLFPILDQRPPIITSIDDVPNDQGLQVQVVWNKCAFDDVYNQNAFYSVWRQDEDFDLILGDVKETDHDLPNNIFADPNEIIQLTEIQQENFYWLTDDLLWTFLDTIPALQYNEYSYIAETLADSTAFGNNEATFKVVFHDDFAYYESESASGYSTDDIAPDMAENITITVQNSSRNTLLTLNWDEVTTGTFAGNTYPEIGGIWYKIYASNSPDFECDETNYLETVSDTFYEFDVTNNPKHFFRIIVSDEP